MRLKLLLVNPWIYDFAAYNMWARPLGLFRVAEYLSSFDVDFSFIDCTSAFKPARFGSGKYRSVAVAKPALLENVPRTFKRYGIDTDEFVRQVKGSMPFDAVLMTSLMSYWYPGVQKSVEIIRELAGEVPVFLGGAYATLYHEHALKSSGADFVFRGPLSESLNFVFSTFGFRLRKKGASTPWYHIFPAGYPFAVLQSSTGCPFRCSYCASELLSGAEYCKRPSYEVLKEIVELYDKGARDYAFYDDALLYDAERHAVPILKSIVDTALPVRFHTPNGLHARFVDEGLASLMRRANFKTVRLSLETVDEERQRNTGNKVSAGDLQKAVALLKRCGFTRNELGVYLMYGLPGQELSEVLEGVNFLQSVDVKICLAEFSPVRGTKSWSELVQNGIIDDTLDPLLTNNTVFSFLYSGYDAGDVQALKLRVKAYNENPC